MSFGGGKEVVDFVRKNQAKVGWVYTPQYWGHNINERFFLDNGAFSALQQDIPWNQDEFVSALARHTLPNREPDFIVLPDIVGFGKDTLKRSLAWLNFMPDKNWYIAVQNGMYTFQLTEKIMKKVKGIFVGGSFEWKQRTSRMWAQHAHKYGKKCHIGRIGTVDKLLWAKNVVGADSVDSSNFVRHPKNWNELMDCFNTGFSPNHSLEQFTMELK